METVKKFSQQKKKKNVRTRLILSTYGHLR